ncbi:MAG: hypothetical protein RL264_2965 [Bacteroidota bacterium]|jgi:hypothetical protein
MSYLFAIDAASHEISVSESPKGSKQIQLVERIQRTDNEILYQAVSLLTSISQAPELDVPLFKAMDKVCQLAYSNYNSKK